MTITQPTVCQQAARAILGAFTEIPYPVRTELGHAMMKANAGTEYGFLATLGLYLAHYGSHPADSPLVVRYLTAAVATEVDRDGGASVIAELSDTEPWGTVRRALEFAAAGPVTDDDRDKWAGATDPRVSV
jgi:hypothetical protein